jgi:hypothetical protein
MSMPMRWGLVLAVVLGAESRALAEDAAPDKPSDDHQDTWIGADARVSYETFFAGTIGGRSVTSIFTGGPATEIELTFLPMKDATWARFHVGYQRIFYGVGNDNPYASLPHASAYANAVTFGWAGCAPLHKRLLGLWAGGDFTVGGLHSDGHDAYGGSASVDAIYATGRFGVGLCLRPVRSVFITSSVLVYIFEANNPDTSVTIGGASSSYTAQGKWELEGHLSGPASRSRVLTP